MRNFNKCNLQKFMNICYLLKHMSMFPVDKMLLNKDKSLTCLNFKLLNVDI